MPGISMMYAIAIGPLLVYGLRPAPFSPKVKCNAGRWRMSRQSLPKAEPGTEQAGPADGPTTCRPGCPSTRLVEVACVLLARLLRQRGVRRVGCAGRQSNRLSGRGAPIAM